MNTPIFSGSGLIALSGGVDSALVLALASENNIQVETATIVSEFTPSREIKIAEKLSRRFGVTWHQISVSLLSDSSIAANPENRCYLCKKRIMGELLSLAKLRNLSCVYDGTHADDLAFGDRPGIPALHELGICSPLQRMTKDEIIAEAKKRNLPIYPPSACIATRIPFGTSFTPSLLQKVDNAENILRDAGVIGILRVRLTGAFSATVEVEPSMQDKVNSVKDRLSSVGITEVSVTNYRNGISFS